MSGSGERHQYWHNYDGLVSKSDLFVVVPFYNEERGMGATLGALAAQNDQDFSLILVDNASSDGSAALAERFAAENRQIDVSVISESQKGTGAASDTGFRFAHGVSIH